MKFQDGCLKKEDADRLDGLIGNNHRPWLYSGLAGFTDDNGQTYKAIDLIHDPEEIEENIIFLIDFLMALKGLSGSNYHKIITMELEDMAREYLRFENGGQYGYDQYRGISDDTYPIDYVGFQCIDTKSIKNAVNGEIKWLKEKATDWSPSHE